jgi:group I intron endonuclease
MGLIYKATNKINGKCYIGQTVNDLQWRKTKHINEAKRSAHNFYFHNALRKYDFDFSWRTLCKCETQEELDRKEIYYIKKFKSEYNILPGGCGNGGVFVGEKNPMFGKHHSDETKRKISETKKNNGLHRGKKNSMYGRKRSNKLKEKVSKANKGRTAWNKGLTKDDPRVKKYSEKRTKTMIEKGYFKNEI